MYRHRVNMLPFAFRGKTTFNFLATESRKVSDCIQREHALSGFVRKDFKHQTLSLQTLTIFNYVVAPNITLSLNDVPMKFINNSFLIMHIQTKCT